MRTRIIVAFAAIMAASALVAVPAPAGSQPPSTARSIDPAQLSAVTLGLPADPATTTAITTTTDAANHSADRLEPGSTIVEPGSNDDVDGRPTVRQPTPKMGSFVKNYWRFDPNISWYGPGFFGNGTACGQTLTKELVGVAHRSLPCGTIVQFRYNGKVVSAPVIDRGPYVAGRTWDLSYGLCKRLGHCFTGTIEWRWGS